MAWAYDKQRVAYIHGFFNERSEYFEEISKKLEQVETAGIQQEAREGSVNPAVFLEGFRLLAAALLSELRLVYETLEHLETGLYYRTAENEFILEQLRAMLLFVGQTDGLKGRLNDLIDSLAALDHQFHEEAVPVLAGLWRTVEDTKREQEEEDRRKQAAKNP